MCVFLGSVLRVVVERLRGVACCFRGVCCSSVGEQVCVSNVCKDVLECTAVVGRVLIHGQGGGGG